MAVSEDGVGEWKGTMKRPVEEVKGHVEVEWKVDALEELPDEAVWHSKAMRKQVTSASAGEVSLGSKTSEAAMRNAVAATWCDKIQNKSETKTRRDSVPKCKVHALFPLQDRGRSTQIGH